RVDLACEAVLDLHHLAVAQHAIELRGGAVGRLVEIPAADNRVRQRAGRIGRVGADVRRCDVSWCPHTRPAERERSLLGRRAASLPDGLLLWRWEWEGRLLAPGREQPRREADRGCQVDAARDQ